MYNSPLLARSLGDGYWEAVDDQDLGNTARDLNGVAKVAKQRGQHVRERRDRCRVLEQGG